MKLPNLIIQKSFSFYQKLLNECQHHELIKLTLYTKEDCSLCEEAKEIIEESYPNKFAFEEVDITKNNRELFRKFKFEIPVFYYNGQLLMKNKVDKKALDDLLKKIEFKNNQIS
jgi:glutaredoxin